MGGGRGFAGGPYMNLVDKIHFFAYISRIGTDVEMLRNVCGGGRTGATSKISEKIDHMPILRQMEFGGPVQR